MLGAVCRRCTKLIVENVKGPNANKSNLYTRPDFTKNQYNVSRGNYNSLEEDHIRFFRNLLGEDRLVMDLCDLEKYNVDQFKRLRGASSIVLKPKTTEEVSNILTFCNNQRLAVVPQGGNTGLVGGSVPIFDEIIITTELMNQIINVEELSGVLTCQSGCVLEKLDDHISQYDLMMPIDLGARGSCHIGGNISTNAGGLRLLRYGSLHGNVLGLEIVRADGGVVDCLNTLRKDNTGYHLKHLFIGSEGTLGFITKVAIQCAVKPQAVHVAFLGVQTFEKALSTLKKAKQDLGETLSAFEFLDYQSVQIMSQNLNISSPIGEYPFYLIVETSGNNMEHDEDKISKFLENALLKHHILNGTYANEPSKIANIWKIRDKITQAFRKDGFVFCYDVSLPYENYYKVVEEVNNHMKEKAHRVFGFGHLGDGNLHLNISVKKFSRDVEDYLEKFLYKRVKELNGSISAEHGIGFLKKKYLTGAKNESYLNLMRSLKQVLDPNKILNPYKVF